MLLQHETGEQPTLILAAPAYSSGEIRFHPDGDYFSFRGWDPIEQDDVMYLGSLSDASYVPLGPGAGLNFISDTRVTYRVRNGRSGHGALFAQDIDLTRGELVGVAVSLVDEISYNHNYTMYVAQPGLLIYLRRHDKVWHDYTTLNMDGQVLDRQTMPGDYWMFQYSLDGKYLARAGRDFLLYDIERGVDELITTHNYPFHFDWSPDSKSIIYLAYPEGNLYERSVNSDESVIVRDSIPRGASQPEWLPDKSAVLLILKGQGSQTKTNLWKYPIESIEPAIQLLEAEANVFMARVSPDGRWIAYVSGSNSSEKEVFIRPFPAMTTRIPVSTSGGNFPNWSQDSNRLWYMNKAGRLEVVEVAGTGSISATALVSERIVSFFPTIHNIPGFAVHPDGDKVFVSDDGLRYDFSEIVIWSNWQSTLAQ